MNTKYKVPNFIWLECLNLKAIKVMCPYGHVIHRAWYPERGQSRYRDCPECVRRYGVGQLKLEITRFNKEPVNNVSANTTAIPNPFYMAPITIRYR